MTPNETQRSAWLILGLGVLLHLACGWLRPMSDALFSDMAVNSLRANLIRDGVVDLQLSFQSLGEPLVLASIMQACRSHVGAIHAILTGLHIVAWVGGGLAMRTLCSAWGLSARGRTLCLLLYAAWLPSALYSNLCLNESFGASLLLIGAAGWLEKKRTPATFGALALGAACLFRPNLMLFVGGLAMLSLAGLVRRHTAPEVAEGERRTGLWFAAFAAVSVALAFGATKVVVPASQGLASSDGMNFYLSVAPVRGIQFPETGWVPVLNHLLFTDLEVADVDMTDRAYFFDKAFAYVRAHPLETVVRWLRNTLESTGYRISYFPGFPGYNAWLIAFSLLSSALTLVGVLHAVRRRALPVAQLTLLAGVTMWVTVMFFMGCPRSRFPFDGLFIVAGVAGLGSLKARFAGARSGPPTAS